MRRILKWTAIAIVPMGIPAALAVWAYRRLTTKNAVIVVREPSTKFVVYQGGKA